MFQKRSPTFKPRFSGQSGRGNLLRAICQQQVVSGVEALARRLIAAGTLQELAANKILGKQGDADNDVYLVVAGSVEIVVNGRQIAVRPSGTHVGEMALLDPTSRRSATMRTLEDTVCLKVSEPNITKIAQVYPQLWRSFAVELGKRLRERSRFLTQPNPVPIVFIGSSSEALAQAQCMARFLKRKSYACKLWTDGVFQLSQTTIESLISVAKSCDFAILCVTPDDLTSSRGRRNSSPRDNVVFELGLFMGSLGRERTFVVTPTTPELKLPTDLLGLTQAVYPAGPKKTLRERLRTASSAVVATMTNLGPK